MHRYYVPQHEPPPINWWPMILAGPILFLPLGFERRGFVQPYEWVLAWLGVAAFLVLFGIALVSWQRRMPFLWIIVPLAALGAAFAPLVYTSVLFLIYAACLVPWAVDGQVRYIVRYSLHIVTVLIALGWGLVPPDQQNWYWLVCPVFCIACAAFFGWVVRTYLRVQYLAKRAERERIARDLHDVLGHTLSLIALKTELAGRVLARHQDAQRARAEMLDVENISRQALADVQQTILGGRAETLEEEIERANVTLRTAGIAVNCEREPLQVDAIQESILGFALREAVTNVVRHAEATNCSIKLQQNEETCVLEVRDDGRGGQEQEGQGLRGMRERVEAVGGSVRRECSAGTRLLVRVPVSWAAT